MGFAKIPTALGFPVRNQLIVGMPENYTWGLGLQDTVDPCLEQALEGLLYGFQTRARRIETARWGFNSFVARYFSFIDDRT